MISRLRGRQEDPQAAGFERPHHDGERPVLVEVAQRDLTDPSEDPIDHIQYRWVYNRWKPVSREGSPHGAWTIALLRLDSDPGLLTAYDNRVRQLERRVEPLDVAREQGDARVIRLEWEAARRDALDPRTIRKHRR